MDSRDLDTDEVARIYDELLETYEREWDYRGHRSLHLSYYDDDHEEPGSAAVNTMRVLSEAAEITAADRVLNIGCGAGEDAVWNARAHGAHVIGVNISESQLEMARENAREHGVEDLTEFRYDDFHELSTVEDGSVTVVWGLEALSHSPDIDRVFDQIDRVLTDDGRVAFTDLFVTASDPGEVDAETRARLETVNDALGVRLGSIDELESVLESHGYRDVTIRNLTEGVLPCTERRHTFARVAAPVSRLLGLVGRGSETRRDVYRANSEIHRLLSDSELGYYLVTARR